jgi:hypothetical protein
MPDITKCKGDGCPLKELCYRYTSVASEYQSYFMTPPIKDGECEHYWEDKTFKQKSKWKTKQQ